MLCKKCGNEYPEGASVCPSCNTSLEQSDKEKQGVFPMGIGRMGFWTAATAYGIPSASVGSAVGGAAVAAAAVAVATAAGATSIPCPEGAARTLYGMPPISSRNFEDRDYERVKDTKLCNHCNAKIKLDAKVCPQCGKKIGFAALSETEDEYKQKRNINN